MLDVATTEMGSLVDCWPPETTETRTNPGGTGGTTTQSLPGNELTGYAFTLPNMMELLAFDGAKPEPSRTIVEPTATREPLAFEVE